MTTLFIIVSLIAASSFGVMLARFIVSKSQIRKILEEDANITIETRRGDKYELTAESMNPAHIQKTVETLLHILTPQNSWQKA
jgi:hypothetical protein